MVVVKQVPLAVSRVPTRGRVVTALQVTPVVVAHRVQVVLVKPFARLVAAHRRLAQTPAHEQKGSE